MGRMYSVGFSTSTIASAVADLLYLKAPSSAILAIHEVVVSQKTSTDSEMVNICIARVGTTGTTGAALTASPLGSGDAAFGGVAEKNPAVSTGLTILYAENINVLNSFHYLPIPETRIILKPGDDIVIRKNTVNSTILAWDCYVNFEEIGN